MIASVLINILKFVFFPPPCAILSRPPLWGFVMWRLNQTRVCDRTILLSLGNFVAYFFFSFPATNLGLHQKVEMRQSSHINLDFHWCGAYWTFSLQGIYRTLLMDWKKTLETLEYIERQLLNRISALLLSLTELSSLITSPKNCFCYFQVFSDKLGNGTSVGVLQQE